jgi:flagellar hook assembly protein FlgD
MRIVSRRLGRSFTTVPAGAALGVGHGRRTLGATAGALVAGAALVFGVLGMPAPPAAAAAPTSGFIVAAAALSPRVAVAAPLAAAPAGVASETAEGGLSVGCGRTLPAGVGPDGRSAVTVDSGARFDMIGVLFRSTASGVRTVQFRLRVSLDRQTWTPWFAIKADAQSGPAGSALSKADLVTEPVWVGAGRYVQCEVSGAGGSPAPVSDVRFACIESAATKEAPATTPQATSPQLGAPPATGNRLGEPAEPAIVTRAQWGADEAYRSGPPSYGVVSCAFVHHTVNANTYTRAQAPALVRGIYYYHTKVNGWNDIGYNFLIDRFGTIYEGRYGGVTKAVIGAQVLGFNSMSTGVSLIGTFESVAPSQAALTSLEKLLAWKLDLSHLNPLGTARVRCATAEMYRAGQWVDVPVIVGHREVNYTACPGNVLFGLLPAIRTAVAGIGDPKVYTPTATPAGFSPNGDGARDTDKLRAVLSGSDDWTIALSDAAGGVVARFSGSGPVASAEWDGRDDAGRRLPDGTYTASFGATSLNGSARPASVAVRIDTVSPSITALSIMPGVISPNGDRIGDAARVAFGVSETSKVSLTVLDAQGAVVRTVAPVSVVGGAARLTWDGKVSSGAALVAAADGSYSVVVRAADAAGNQSTMQRALTVDSTLGHPRVAPAWLSPNGDGVDDAMLLSFQTTRSARVGVAIAGPTGTVVRRVSLGSLASGRHSWLWDGKNTSGDVVGDGAWSCTLTAVNGIGTVAIKLRAHVDTVAPLAAWRSSAATLKLGKSLRAAFSVADGLSPKAAATVVVRSAGVTVAAVSLPAAATGIARSWSFRPKARGKYTMRLSAVDLAGNRQTVAARLVVTVR